MTTSTQEHTRYPRASATELLRLSPTRLKIVDAAAEAFMERGYDSTSIDEIAERIGATKGAVYYNYRSKFDIFLAVYERGMLLLEERMVGAMASTSGLRAADRLRAVSVGHAENIMRHLKWHLVIQHGVEQRRQMALKEGDRARLAALDATRERHEELVRSLIEEGQVDGSIRPFPARLATRTLIGGIVGIAIWYRPREEQSEDDRLAIAEQVVEMLLTGLLST